MRREGAEHAEAEVGSAIGPSAISSVKTPILPIMPNLLDSSPPRHTF